jgi:signal transduction histidine kinase/CheY-like chemotaxis protein
MLEDTSILKLQITELLSEANKIRVNKLPQSIELAQQALVISRQLADNTLTGKALCQLSLFYMIKGEFETATDLANQAIKQYETAGDEHGIAEANFTIASVHYKTDNFHLGLKYLLTCAATYKKYNDYFNLARTLKSVGTIYEFFNDPNNAVDAYEQAITAAETAGDLNLKSNVYNPLSGIYLNQGKTALALHTIEDAIALKLQTGDERGLAFSYYGRGKVFTFTKEYNKADADLIKALEIHRNMGEKLGEALTLYKLGFLYFVQQKFGTATNYLQWALEISNAYKMMLVTSKCNELLYRINKAEGNNAAALALLELYHQQQEVMYHKQTLQVITSYDMLLKMEAKMIEDRVQLEKNEILDKKNKAEYTAKAKQDFLSNMSHEIRTPLNAVITITGLLNDRADEEDQKLLQSLKFASGNLLQLINDILDFSKLEHDKVILEYRPVHLRKLLNNLKNTYDSLAKEKGLTLLLEIDEAVAEAYELDETKFSQIAGNLLSNAIKFTDKGTVSIEVSLLMQQPDTHTLRFKIVDTGIGIPEYFLAEIFDNFTQFKLNTTKKEGGTGLGLAIVKKLVELHESKIHITTKLAEGSTFYFDLNLRTADVPLEIPVKAVQQFTNLNVLLAEDNTINTLVATKLLAKWGINAACVVNGLQAIEKAKSKKYDIILMDIHMPEMNGYDAAAIIRQTNNVNVDTPIYALTADINAAAIEEYTAYFNGFLRKPIEVNHLYKTLSSVV